MQDKGLLLFRNSFFISRNNEKVTFLETWHKKLWEMSDDAFFMHGSHQTLIYKRRTQEQYAQVCSDRFFKIPLPWRFAEQLHFIWHKRENKSEQNTCDHPPQEVLLFSTGLKTKLILFYSIINSHHLSFSQQFLYHKHIFLLSKTCFPSIIHVLNMNICEKMGEYFL